MKALNTQVGGDHYKQFEIQPIEFCHRNKLGPIEANIIKYVCRHKFKDGVKDLKKAMHYLNILLQLDYPEEDQYGKEEV